MFGRTKQNPANPIAVTKDPSGAPAVDLDAVKAAGHVDLAKRAESVGVSLRKRNLAGMRGRVVVVLDHSGSMHGDYASGLVQKLLERTLAFGLQIDSDAAIEVIAFDSRVWPTRNVSLTDYRQAAASVWHRNAMGSTDLTAALGAVKLIGGSTKEPVVCVVITDGQPNDTRTATAAVVDLARYPVFLKFLALRDVPYLRQLDDMDGRLVDNADAKTIEDPAGISDEDFAEAMADEWDGWLTAAKSVGVIR